MIYKSYLLEKNFKSINCDITLFYGENIGLRNDFKNIIKSENPNVLIKKFDQENIIKDTEFFLPNFLTFLYLKKKYFFLSRM